jgi:hypothetical protein
MASNCRTRVALVLVLVFASLTSSLWPVSAVAMPRHHRSGQGHHKARLHHRAARRHDRRGTRRRHRKVARTASRLARCHSPVVALAPSGLSVLAPQSASFSAAALVTPGCAAASVRWQVAVGADARFINLPGATSATLRISSTDPSMTGNRYRAVFTDRAGSQFSSPATLTVSASPGAGGSRLFAAGSVWNQPLPVNVPLDPSSPKRIASLMDDINPPGPGVWLNWSQYSVPVYQVSANQPTVRVSLDVGAPMLQSAWQAVPIPAAAIPAAGSDASAVIYQPSTDKMWEFWQLSKQSDGFHARWGGAMASVSSNPGYYSSASWPALPPGAGWDWGSSASSLPAVAGLMTISELRSGHIDHALSVATTQACKWYVWPAQRTDGTSNDSNCLPEGAHLRLDPSLDLTKLSLPPIALMMAQAMQKYGIIVHDTTNSSVTFYAEQPADGTDPYSGPNGFFGGQPEWQFLRELPWSHLQLLKLGPQCAQGPCAAG